VNQIRRNPITGDPVIFAPARAARPHAFGDPAPTEERCPFCPGNESDTPPSIVEVGVPWRARVFPNRYPPTAGAEVLVESPDHSRRFEELEDPASIVGLYVARLHAHRNAAHAALFRNDGPRAGASIEHPHSQLVPLTFVPLRVQQELDGFRTASGCPLCAPFDAEPIAEDDAFRWVAPAASRFAWQQWIVAKRHVPSLVQCTTSEQESLARLLVRAARASRSVGDSFNWAFLCFSDPAGHFYVDVIPRVTTIAGLELGSGTFVEIMDPAAAAQRFRL
jgi:UDPglucose--hexose-1-phosphate uridylyltransferase